MRSAGHSLTGWMWCSGSEVAGGIVQLPSSGPLVMGSGTASDCDVILEEAGVSGIGPQATTCKRLQPPPPQSRPVSSALQGWNAARVPAVVMALQQCMLPGIVCWVHRRGVVPRWLKCPGVQSVAAFAASGHAAVARAAQRRGRGLMAAVRGVVVQSGMRGWRWSGGHGCQGAPAPPPACSRTWPPAAAPG